MIVQPDGSIKVIPGGSDTYVQFNNSGAFDGDGRFVYDKADTLTVPRNVTTVGPLTLTATTAIYLKAAAGRDIFMQPNNGSQEYMFGSTGLDFDTLKAIAMACDNGTSFPSSPKSGQWYYYTPRMTLYFASEDKAAYVPADAVASFGDVTIYVNADEGTDAITSGAAATPCATFTYAASLIPTGNTGSIVIQDSPSNLRSATYKWTLSASGTAEYYCELAAGGDPGISTPFKMAINSLKAAEGTVGSLAAGEWDYADNDSLGYSTVYVRLSDDTDPDTKASGYVTKYHTYSEAPAVGSRVLAGSNTYRIVGSLVPVTTAVTADQDTGSSFKRSVGKASSGWTVNGFVDMVVEVTGGTGVGAMATILSNDADTININGAWFFASNRLTGEGGTRQAWLDTTSQFRILDWGTKITGAGSDTDSSCMFISNQDNISIERLFLVQDTTGSNNKTGLRMEGVSGAVWIVRCQGGSGLKVTGASRLYQSGVLADDCTGIFAAIQYGFSWCECQNTAARDGAGNGILARENAHLADAAGLVASGNTKSGLMCERGANIYVGGNAFIEWATDLFSNTRYGAEAVNGGSIFGVLAASGSWSAANTLGTHSPSGSATKTTNTNSAYID